MNKLLILGANGQLARNTTRLLLNRDDVQLLGVSTAGCIDQTLESQADAPIIDPLRPLHDNRYQFHPALC